LSPRAGIPPYAPRRSTGGHPAEGAGPSAQKYTADGDDRDHYDDQKPELSTEHIRPFDEASAHILISNYFIFTRHYFENSKICGIMANDYYIFF